MGGGHGAPPFALRQPKNSPPFLAQKTINKMHPPWRENKIIVRQKASEAKCEDAPHKISILVLCILIKILIVRIKNPGSNNRKNNFDNNNSNDSNHTNYCNKKKSDKNRNCINNIRITK